MSNINLDKYKNVILYLIKKLGGTLEGKKKLYKLLYFIDFDFYEKYERKLIGDVYEKLPMGPVPLNCDKIVEELQGEGKLNLKEKVQYSGYFPTTIYTQIHEPDLNVLSKEEIAMLDRIIGKYGRLSGKDLERLTHNEAPYVATAPSAIIEYENAFYRGTFDEIEGA